ncbi:MAG: SEC-C domain-containing protein, partial [Holosporales bacterium]|nr:SEC-C domain-containing protein [Holosporales bacterium]
IISGANDETSQLYVTVDSVIKGITDGDFEIDEKLKVATLTEAGVEKIEKKLNEIGLLSKPELYDLSNFNIVYHVNCALKANKLFAKNVDYIVRNGQVLIIDEFTGRVMDGRRYSDGLHQALEAKEGVKVQSESQTVATISYQNLFRLYPKLSGMTGTAMTEEAEFEEIYKLKVVSIPSHKTVIRKDYEDSLFMNFEERDKAVVALIKECNERKQPVLVGTTSLERSEYISELLKKEGIRHNVLNAKQHEREAHIVAEAGTSGAVTIATNMAGRGTDIKLGGNAETRIVNECESIADPAERRAKIQKIKSDIQQDHEFVKSVGGLFVIGTERNESRRIDNQLRGRSGRQGDPGASKFFLSIEDDLIRRFGSQNLAKTMQKIGAQKDEVLEYRWLSKIIAKAQQRVEAYNFDIRKQLLKYDDVMNDQRKIVYEQRNNLMQSEDITDEIKDMIYNVIDDWMSKYAPPELSPLEWNLTEFAEVFDKVFKVKLNVKEIIEDPSINSDTFKHKLEELAILEYEKKNNLDNLLMQNLGKDIILKSLDVGWRNHLVALEHLRRGINLRAYAQKNPLNEYKFEAFNIFEDMLRKVELDVITKILNIKIPDPISSQPAPIEEQSKKELPLFVESNSRNALCSCGSGKKYKHCCGRLNIIRFTVAESATVNKTTITDKEVTDDRDISGKTAENRTSTDGSVMDTVGADTKSADRVVGNRAGTDGAVVNTVDKEVSLTGKRNIKRPINRVETEVRTKTKSDAKAKIKTGAGTKTKAAVATSIRGKVKAKYKTATETEIENKPKTKNKTNLKTESKAMETVKRNSSPKETQPFKPKRTKKVNKIPL